MNVDQRIRALADGLIAAAQSGHRGPYKPKEGWSRNVDCKTCGGAIVVRDERGITRTCDPCFRDYNRPLTKGVPGADPKFSVPAPALATGAKWLRRSGRRALLVTGHLAGTRSLAHRLATAAEQRGDRYAVVDILAQCPLSLYDETEQVSRWEVRTRALRRADLMVITGMSPMLRGRQARDLAQLMTHAGNEGRAVLLVGDLPSSVPDGCKPADHEAWNLILRELHERLGLERVTV